MGQLLLGEFAHTLDDKGRLTVPAKFRGQLSAGLVITKGVDLCLWLFPMNVWEDVSEKIRKLPLTDPGAREFRRQVFGTASDSMPDKQGRVILPPNLRSYAGIDGEAVIIGLHDHCEIWNPERWRERQEQSDRDPDARAQQFANLGI